MPGELSSVPYLFGDLTLAHRLSKECLIGVAVDVEEVWCEERQSQWY